MHTPEGTPLPPNALAEVQRDLARLRFVVGQIKQIEEARRQRLEEQPERGPHAMVRLLARVVGIGIETADMLVNEVLSRPMRDRRAVARRRPDGCAGRERRQAAGTRACQSRQCPGPPWDDPTRLALSAVSKEQRTGPVVPDPYGRSPWRHAQNNDRRPGAKAAHRALAICHHWRAIGRRHAASGKLNEPLEDHLLTLLDAGCWHPQRGLPVDDPRWREPVADVAPMPTKRMGPPPGASPPMRMTASWSGSNDPTVYKSAARRCAPNGELPSDSQK